MKTIFVSALLGLASLFAGPAQAIDLTRTDFDAFAHFLNTGSQTPGVFSRYDAGTQMILMQKRMVRCTYDFGVLGGAVAALNLRASTTYSASVTAQPCRLPKGAIITNAYIDAITTLTSGGSATVAISSGEAAGDLLAALAFNDAKFTGNSAHPAAMIPVGTAATAFKLTADRIPTATIAVAALTAGKFYVIIEYDLSQTL
jgi:hypothetical protein